MVNGIGNNSYSIKSNIDNSPVIELNSEKLSINPDVPYSQDNSSDLADISNPGWNDDADSFYNNMVTDVIKDISNQGFKINPDELSQVLSEAITLLV